jgi:hypothetical protein
MVTAEAEPHHCLAVPGLPIGWDPAGEEGPGWYLLYGDVDGPRALRIRHCPFCGARLRSRAEPEDSDEAPGVIYPKPGRSG